MFEGKLPPVPIKIGNSKGRLGTCFYTVLRRPGQKPVNAFFHLRFSSAFDLPEEEWEDTIIHEMIHYFIGVNQLEDTSAHGPVFVHMMNTINEKFGRHLTVSHKSTKEEREQAIDTKAHWHVVAIVSLKNGKTGIKVLPRVLPKILNQYNTVGENKTVDKIELFMSNNPYFNRFPNSGALNVQYIERDEVMEQLKGAEVMECNGKEIIRGK